MLNPVQLQTSLLERQVISHMWFWSTVQPFVQLEHWYPLLHCKWELPSLLLQCLCSWILGCKALIFAGWSAIGFAFIIIPFTLCDVPSLLIVSSSMSILSHTNALKCFVIVGWHFHLMRKFGVPFFLHLHKGKNINSLFQVHFINVFVCI